MMINKELEEIKKEYTTNREMKNFYRGVKKIKQGCKIKTSFYRDKDGNLVGLVKDAINYFGQNNLKSY